ncbi:MAG: tandem-95 repeat protein, partial [Verrucomicrobia bacterium]|nr:tandem-95 repeat protein [Verrucomicrobiota bacterium]
MPLSPAGDAAMDLVSRSFVYAFVGDNEGWSLSQPVPNGAYQFYVWTVEHFQNHDRDIDLRAEGIVVATNLGDVNLGEWRKHGPFPATVTDGKFDLEALRRTKGTPTLFGFALFRPALSNTPPAMSAISNQNVTLNHTLGPLSFTVADAETAASNLVLFAASANPTLLPTNNIVFGGSGTNRTVTLTPAFNQTGAVNITITVHDNTYATTSQSFQVNVLAGNQTPSASNQSVTLPEDAATGIALAGFDPEGSNLTFTVVSGPAHGAFSAFNTNSGALTYLAQTNFFGSDSFTFSVSDGQATSAVATVSLVITNVNDPPVASNQTVTLAEDTSVVMQLTGFDLEGSNLTFTVVKPTDAGSLTIFTTNVGTITYTPLPNFFGTDSFTFSVSDGQLTSAVATVSLIITNVNDPPVVSNRSLTLPEDTATNLLLSGFDVEGSNLTVTI